MREGRECLKPRTKQQQRNGRKKENVCSLPRDKLCLVAATKYSNYN